MKRCVIISTLLITVILRAYTQTDSSHGIDFLQNTSWKEVLQKARTENKYIFVDCYATWCGPCKWMDKIVYVNDTIARIMNQQFVSVRMQMDSTAKDGDNIRASYSTAHYLDRQYHINAYPTYLFFSPDGHVVHKAIGAHDVHQFTKLAEDAKDPRRQFYTLLAEYQHGNMGYAAIHDLAEAAKKLQEDSLAKVGVGF